MYVPQLLDILEWCLELGVSNVSVFAFGVDNFKRDPQEVADLMRLAEEKLWQLLEASTYILFLAGLHNLTRLSPTNQQVMLHAGIRHGESKIYSEACRAICISTARNIACLGSSFAVSAYQLLALRL